MDHSEEEIEKTASVRERAIVHPAWLGGNFLIPIDGGILKETIKELEELTRSPLVLLPKHRGVYVELWARLSALKAYERHKK